MSYSARRNGEYDKELQDKISAAKNANNIRNAADLAIASKNPYAAAAGGAVKVADKATGGKASEALGSALQKANQRAPGGRHIQDTLDKLNDSGLSDKLGEAAYAYHKYMDHANKTASSTEQPQPQKKSPRGFNELDNSDVESEGAAKGNVIMRVAAIATIILLLPMFLVVAFAVSAATTHNNFEDALGASYINNEPIGGFVEVAESSKDAQKFYERIAEVKEELAAEGMIFESIKIVSVYRMINSENNNFTYKKMTKAKIKEIAKSMFREEKNDEGEIIYIYDEELFKENLKEKIYKKQFLLYSDKKREEMAKNTIEYINDYYGYIGENPQSSGTVSSGEYTTWKQYSGPWTGVQLGSSGKSISQIGCAATSVSILIAKSGVQTTVNPLNPGTFVTKLNQSGGFGSGSCQGCINWASASAVAPSFKYVGRTSVAGNTKEQKLSSLKTLLDQGYYVVAEVKGDTGEHWVAIDAIQQNNIIMIDPGSSNTNMWQTYPWNNTSTYIYYRAG